MKKWLCIICGLIYDEAKGWPADGIAPGTRWQDVPDDWECPDCGVAKSDFEMIEIAASEQSKSTSTQVAQKHAPIVIIGSGHAGYSLAESIRQRAPDREIMLLTADSGSLYSKPSLSNALTRNKTAAELVSENVLAIEKRLNIRIHAHCEVTGIDPEKHIVHTSLGDQQYSKLVLAVGAEPIRLNIDGDCQEDILSINDLQSYSAFRDKLTQAKHVTIIGNGLIGCEFADDLSNQGFKVSVVGLTAWPMDRLIPREIGEQLQAKLAEQNVDWHLENSVALAKRASTTGFAAERNGSENNSRIKVTLNDGQIFETDLIISAVGLRPRMALAKSAGVDCNLGIKVNGGLRTNVADIYALGDCAEINGQLLPYIAPINFAVRALADCLLDKPTMAQYPLMPIIVKTPSYPLTLLPPTITQVGANNEGKWQVETTDQGTRGLYLCSEGNVLGYALNGQVTNERQQWTDQIALSRH